MKKTKRLNTALKSIVASIMLAVLTAAPTYASSCGPDSCLSPCNYDELLSDTTFTGKCPQWVWNGSAQRVQIGSNWVAELPTPGSVSQTVAFGRPYSAMQVSFDVYIRTNAPGTERLYVEILRDYYVLETLEVLYPDSPEGTYSMSIANYSNSEDNIKIRFRYVGGTPRGNTDFRIDNVVMFGTF